MKKLTFTFISLAFAVSLAQGADPAQESVRKLSISEIHADAGVLEGQQYVATGQPDEEVLKEAREAGFAAVVDLRTEGEDRGFDEPAVVNALGMSYHSIPVTGAAGTTFDNAKRLDEVLSGIDGPVLVHCASGNRVGALFALRASLHGASDEEALEVGKAAGLTRLEPAVTKQLEKN